MSTSGIILVLKQKPEAGEEPACGRISIISIRAVFGSASLSLDGQQPEHP